ncbi:MAG TPA: S-adenosylmethionine decarboxylase [Blastocatellia bacterium]
MIGVYFDMVGKEWLVDASGCNAALVRDGGRVLSLCDRVIQDLDLHVIGQPVVQEFPGGGGLTVFYLLTESHLACHTYPESGVVTFNLYCCRQRAEWNWLSELAVAFGATDVRVAAVVRGEA